MEIRLDAFHALIEEVESQGGMSLPEKCFPEEVEFKPPQKDVPGTMTCGCMHETRIVSIYDPGDVKVTGSGFVTACVICDNAGVWPRYGDVVKDIDSSYWDNLEDEEE